MADPKKNNPPHVLDELVARAGKDNPKLLDALLHQVSNEELVEVGTQIATHRLVTDGVRLYGEALDFFEGASVEQKKRLRGASLSLIYTGIHHLAALKQLEGEVLGKAQENSTERVLSEAESKQMVTDAVVLRDQAFDALRDAGQEKKARLAVEQAFGVADPPESLAKGLDDMAALLKKWLASKDEALQTRLELANLDKDYAGELTAAARAVRVAAAAAAKRVSPKATQSTLDREDGVQTRILGQMIRAFESANGRDPTIPRLVPISARRLFNRNTSKRAAPVDGDEATDKDAKSKPE